MWQQSENARLERELSAYIGADLMKKFRTAPRESLRLAAALRGLFALDAAPMEDRPVYREYLSHRPIPAVTALVEENRMGDLEALWPSLTISDNTLETLLQSARELGRPEAIVFFLREKAKRGTFRDRDFSL